MNRFTGSAARSNIDALGGWAPLVLGIGAVALPGMWLFVLFVLQASASLVGVSPGATIESPLLGAIYLVFSVAPFFAGFIFALWLVVEQRLLAAGSAVALGSLLGVILVIGVVATSVQGGT
jgi:hypothetical protein